MVPFIVCVIALAMSALTPHVQAQSPAPTGELIPFLAAPDFGWQSNVADWQEPPPGYGHGPIPRIPI